MSNFIPILLLAYAFLQEVWTQDSVGSKCNPPKSNEIGVCKQRHDCSLNTDTFEGTLPKFDEDECTFRWRLGCPIKHKFHGLFIKRNFLFEKRNRPRLFRKKIQRGSSQSRFLSRYAIECPSPLVCCLPRKLTGAARIKSRVGPSDGCGWLKDGTDLRAGRVPWNVAIMVPVAKKNDKISMRFLSNGVLIHPRVVLTTRRKVVLSIRPDKNKQIFAVVGDYDQRVVNSLKKAYLIEDVVTNDDFKDKFDNNTAIIRLRRAVEGPNIRTICLPTNSYQVAEGTRCFYTGWGLDGGKPSYHRSKLALTSVWILGRKTCSLKMRPKLGRYYVVPWTVICAGADATSDLCTGDGGSPLVCPTEKDPDRFELIGLMSFVHSCGNTGRPAGFTDISFLVKWIRDQMDSWGLPLDN